LTTFWIGSEHLISANFYPVWLFYLSEPLQYINNIKLKSIKSIFVSYWYRVTTVTSLLIFCYLHYMHYFADLHSNTIELNFIGGLGNDQQFVRKTSRGRSQRIVLENNFTYFKMFISFFIHSHSL